MFTTTHYWHTFEEEMPGVGLPIMLASLGQSYGDEQQCAVDIHRTLYYIDRDNQIVEYFNHQVAHLGINSPHHRKKLYWAYLTYVDDIHDPRDTIPNRIGNALAGNVNQIESRPPIVIGPIIGNTLDAKREMRK